MMRYIMSYGVALVVLLLIAGWLASGTLIQGGNGPGNGEQAIVDLIEPEQDGPVRRLFISLGLIAGPDSDEETAPDPEIAKEETGTSAEEILQSVRTVRFDARPMTLEVAVRGQTKADATISVRAETSGIVQELHVSKGQRVEPGDLLCTLDRGTREAKLAQAEASLAQAQVALERAREDLQTNASLREKGLAAANTARQFEVSLTSAEANYRAALASLDDIKSDIEHTEVRAEVGGTVQDPLASVGDMLGNGDICATIVQLDPMLFSGKVAETKVNLVHVGQQAKVTMVTGQTIEGRVRYVSASADPSTRAFELEVELDNPNGDLLNGVTASAKVQVGAIQAHLIPQSALTLKTDGTLGVQIVVDKMARFRPVQIVGDDSAGIWVSGLPSQADVITLGQEYVRDGQRVDASPVGETQS
ncbi:MAG TPA: efflux RND transporter periplasmic adaptor subunit [Devosia sp.]|nr:efflux RND transporter periplasmic adaptor subunit [Devosia sp.]